MYASEFAWNHRPDPIQFHSLTVSRLKNKYNNCLLIFKYLWCPLTSEPVGTCVSGYIRTCRSQNRSKSITAIRNPYCPIGSDKFNSILNSNARSILYQLALQIRVWSGRSAVPCVSGISRSQSMSMNPLMDQLFSSFVHDLFGLSPQYVNFLHKASRREWQVNGGCFSKAVNR